MNAQLHVTFAPAEGAMLRILGLIERRGYVIRELSMTQRPPGAALSIAIEARDDGRQPAIVVRQIGNLHDVSSVDLTITQARMHA